MAVVYVISYAEWSLLYNFIFPLIQLRQYSTYSRGQNYRAANIIARTL
jgi:hypothetical protein